MAKLKEGDKAPDFELLNQEGEGVRLSEFLGNKNVVLYFYPKDETPGCTKEACEFRDSYAEFVDNDTEVLGISSDSVDSHKSFQLNRRLPFQLLSDPQEKVRKQFEVSRSFLGLIPGRETFVIDKQGIIRLRIATQLPHPHIRQSLKVIRDLVEEASSASDS